MLHSIIIIIRLRFSINVVLEFQVAASDLPQAMWIWSAD